MVKTRKDEKVGFGRIDGKSRKSKVWWEVDTEN